MSIPRRPLGRRRSPASNAESFKTITKRHLETHGLTPAEYKAKWGYPKGQPLSCRDTAKARSERMKNMELWKKTKPKKAPAKKPETK